MRILSSLLVTSLFAAAGAAPIQAQELAPIKEIVPLPAPTPTLVPPPPAAIMPPVPPTAQAYIATEGGPARLSYSRMLVPVSFFANGLGASVGPVDKNHWRLLYFDRIIDFYPYQKGILVNGKSTSLPTHPQVFGKELYLPFAAFADILGLKWSLAPGYDPKTDKQKTVFLIQYPAAYVTEVRSSVEKDVVRTVVTLSNPTRITASQNPQDASFSFAGSRQGSIPDVDKVGDYLVPRTVLRSGNWLAKFSVHLNYRAPIRWYTVGNPARLVIDSQRLFEEQSTEFTGGIKLTKIRRGTGHGPVQMYLARLDPQDGWRVGLASGGSNVLQRARPSRLAARNKAVLAVNGGFFAYDGAAVGAVMARGEWIRLPWQGRTAVGFTADGTARIDNLQVQSYVEFSGGLKVPIRDLNGWPDKNRVTLLTRRFATFYKLRPSEMGLVLANNIVTAKPGGGGFNIPVNGYALVANGGAKPVLNQITRGQQAKVVIKPIGWSSNLVTALGGGPRLVKNSQIYVTDENFRSDVLNGAGPRTAFGVDKQGRYIILAVDGRQKYHSTGLTLQELAITMRKLGAVNAMNLDGGGSTAMVVRGKVINRPSDGVERGVANALLVTR